jgi:hypothetical protein
MSKLLGYVAFLTGLASHFYAVYMASTVSGWFAALTFPFPLISHAVWYLYFFSSKDQEAAEFRGFCVAFFISLFLFCLAAAKGK